MTTLIASLLTLAIQPSAAMYEADAYQLNRQGRELLDHHRYPAAVKVFRRAVEQQVAILSTSDAFVILGALTLFLMVVVITLPVQTFPPRIVFARR